MNGHVTRSRAEQAEHVVRAVPDPEMPYITLGDLGVVSAVTVDADASSAQVTLLPTFLGCPATEVIRADVESALMAEGWDSVTVELRFDPPWTPDRITARGRAKLAEAGVAPTETGGPRSGGPGSGPVFVELGAPRSGVPCPNCGARETRLLSAFGPAPCQELRRCASCAEPFPAMKAAT